MKKTLIIQELTDTFGRALRVVWGWDLGVGTHIVINKPLPDETFLTTVLEL